MKKTANIILAILTAVSIAGTVSVPVTAAAPDLAAVSQLTQTAEEAAKQQAALLAAQQQTAAEEAAKQQAALLAAQQAAAEEAAKQQAALLAAQQQAAAEEAAKQQAALLAAQQQITAEEAAKQQAALPAAEGALQQPAVLPAGRLIAAGLLSSPVDTPLKGKTLSIIGDSISTYEGYIPSEYACFYPEQKNDLKDVTQTWWMQILYNTGMRLGTNASYSASTVCGDAASDEKASAASSNARIKALLTADGAAPDVILVYIGANDFFRSFEIGKYDGVPVSRGSHYILDFTEAYELMVQKLLRTYPNSKIYLCTLIEANSGDHPRVNERGNTIQDFNARIKQIAAAYALPVMDIHACGLEVYELNFYTSDGVHPNQKGARKMSDYVTSALLLGI